jgi:hypothetical protein
VYALFEEYKSRIFAYLISKKVNVQFRKFKQAAGSLFEKKEAVFTVSPETRVKGRCPEAGILLDTSSREYKLLKSYLNDFLYATEEQYTATGIHQLSPTIFLLQGSQFYQKVHTRP